MFDDTIEHEAWNDSDETRVILIVDVWNPLVTAAERDLVSRLLDAKRAYCVIEPGVGFFDLYEQIQREKAPLWLSVPGNAWGSVLGNALELAIPVEKWFAH